MGDFLEVKITNGSVFIAELRKYKKTLHDAMVQAVSESAILVQSKARQLIIKGPKTGKTYMRGKVKHQASAPGEPPASDTGTLVSRVINRVNASKVEAYVIANIAYASYLEFGTKKMKPRPFMYRAARESADGIRKIFTARLKGTT